MVIYKNLVLLALSPMERLCSLELKLVSIVFVNWHFHLLL